MKFKFYTKCMHMLPPEIAHHLSIWGLRYFAPEQSIEIPSGLSQTLWKKKFAHPIGLAAGFDKDAEAYDALGHLGFSFVEVGSITPKAQLGNPRPRLFRIKEHQAIINRYGFNSKGMKYAKRMLENRRDNLILGINLGKNKDTVNYLDDFLQVAETLIPYANYLTINLSSPNTPGLRDLQQAETIEPLLKNLDALRVENANDCPIFIKLSPDIAPSEESELLYYLAGSIIDGIIVSNTTINRDNLSLSPTNRQSGGLSGKPLQKRSRDMLMRVYSIVGRDKTIIASGGINSGVEAYERICMGASLCQIYTSFVYEGPDIISRMLTEMEQCMQRDGYTIIEQAIGSYYARYSK